MISRVLVAVALAIGLGVTAPGVVAAQQARPAHEFLQVQGRQVDLNVWPAEGETRAVVVFSHGAGGEPAAYERIIHVWTAAGFVVLAPLHVDSQHYAEPGKYNLQQAFMLRIADLAAVRELARERFPGLPLIAAGHSYGSLMSAIEGGAVTAVGPRGDPDVDALILISSAGRIQGLIRPDTYGAVSVPTFTLTGDADHVDGYAADWRDHRAVFDGAGGAGHVLVMVEGGDHGLIRNADADDFDLFSRASVDFVLARTLGDRAAAARLDALSADGVVVERR